MDWCTIGQNPRITVWEDNTPSEIGNTFLKGEIHNKSMHDAYVNLTRFLAG